MKNVLEIKYLDNNISNEEMNYMKNFIPKRYDECLTYKSNESRKLALISRIMICNNLNVTEDKIQFNKLKKPYIENSPFFNVSHSRDYVIFAKSEMPIGIDIEYVSKKNMCILNYAYTESEKDYILKSEDEFTSIEKLTMLWTIKESLFKASGSEKYLEPKNIKVYNYKSIEFLGKKYNIYSCKFKEYFISVASIIQYDEVVLSKDTIYR